MASPAKQLKRAQRAKLKARQGRLQRGATTFAFISDELFDPIPLGLGDLLLDELEGASAASVTLQTGGFGFMMTAIIDHDEDFP